MKALRSLLLAVLCLLVLRVAVVAQQSSDCNALQRKFDQVYTSPRYSPATSWAALQALVGTPARVAEQQGSNPTLFYLLPGCSAEFTIDDQGLIRTKNFKLERTGREGIGEEQGHE